MHCPIHTKRQRWEPLELLTIFEKFSCIDEEVDDLPLSRDTLLEFRVEFGYDVRLHLLSIGPSAVNRHKFLFAASGSRHLPHPSVPSHSFVSLQPAACLDIPICKSFRAGYQGRTVVSKRGICAIHRVPYQVILSSSREVFPPAGLRCEVLKGIEDVQHQRVT